MQWHLSKKSMHCLPTWNVSVISVDSKISVRWNDATLKYFLSHH